jgi:hypothetical protein
MAPLLADVKIIDAALKRTPGLLDASLMSKFEDAKANLSILQKDGSRGFHNFVFSLEITSLAAGDLKEIKAVIKSSDRKETPEESMPVKGKRFFEGKPAVDIAVECNGAGSAARPARQGCQLPKDLP